MEQSNAYLIILPSGKETADVQKTIDSFLKVDIFNDITEEYIKTVDIIGAFKQVTPNALNEVIEEANNKGFTWYILMYDDEIISSGLRKALTIYLTMDTFDFLILYKKTKEEKIYINPRIFRSTIFLDPAKIIPKDGYEGLRLEKALDGWVKDQ